MTPNAAIALVAGGRWSDYKRWLASVSPEAAYESIKLVFEGCALGINLDGVADGPDDVLGLTVMGAMYYGIGKRHRGGAQASAVSEAQADRYVERLIVAKSLLEDALAIDRRYGLAAAFYMLVATDELEEGQKDNAEAILLDAENVPLSGYMNLLIARLEKWGGSHGDMFRIARSRLRPDLPMQAALIARAHWERELFYSAFDDEPGAAGMAEVYYQGEVGDELMEASRLVLAAGNADASEARVADSWLAFALGRAGRYKQAVRHLDRLKGYEDPSVWKILVAPPWLTKGLIRLQAMMGKGA